MTREERYKKILDEYGKFYKTGGPTKQFLLLRSSISVINIEIATFNTAKDAENAWRHWGPEYRPIAVVDLDTGLEAEFKATYTLEGWK